MGTQGCIDTARAKRGRHGWLRKQSTRCRPIGGASGFEVRCVQVLIHTCDAVPMFGQVRARRSADAVRRERGVECVLAGGGYSGVIGSSDQVHMVDALAATGDEGRGSLR